VAVAIVELGAFARLNLNPALKLFWFKLSDHLKKVYSTIPFIFKLLLLKDNFIYLLARLI